MTRPSRHIRPTAGPTRHPVPRRLQRRDTTTGDNARLAEQHRLDPAARQREWIALVEWVAWLHDTYELSVDMRLPECWPDHSGLVEELRALKTWRDEIYSPTTTGPQGQAARYWHGELRSLIASVREVYAHGCRAHHRTGTAATHHQILDWHLKTPTNPRGQTCGEILGSTPDAVMTQALFRRAATALSPHNADFVSYRGGWWMRTNDGWTPVTHTDLVTRLDTVHEKEG